MASELALNRVVVEECEVVVHYIEFGQEVHNASDWCHLQETEKSLHEGVWRHMRLLVEEVARVNLEPVGDKVREEDRSKQERKAHTLPLILDRLEA